MKLIEMQVIGAMRPPDGSSKALSGLNAALDLHLRAAAKNQLIKFCIERDKILTRSPLPPIQTDCNQDIV